MTTFEAAKAAALQTIHDYWGHALPVDCTLIAERMGIEVKTTPMTFVNKSRDDDLLSIIYHFNGHTRIVTDENQTLVKRNRLVAYEIGHYYHQALLKRNNDFTLTNWIHPEKHLKRHWWSRPEDHSVTDAFANAFSLWLIMPESELKHMDPNMTRLAVAEHFSVTMNMANEFLQMLKDMGEIDANAFAK